MDHSPKNDKIRVQTMRGEIIGVFTGNETKFDLKKHKDTDFGQTITCFAKFLCFKSKR